MIAEGQIAGAIAHGIGNTLYEWMAYDDDAQPMATTLADYLLVTASDIPELVLGHRETPTTLNPLGVKGIGESGVVPIPAAIVRHRKRLVALRCQAQPISGTAARSVRIAQHCARAS